MFIFRKIKASSIFFIVILVFAVQALSLIILSFFYPQTKFRTSVIELFLDDTQYYSFISFIIAFLGCNWLLSKLNELRKELPLILTWNMTEPEKVKQRIQKDLQSISPTWKWPLIMWIISCTIYFALTRCFGTIESLEPVEVTLVLIMNDFVAITGLVLILYFSCFVSRSILLISKINYGSLNIFHVDRMGGVSIIGKLASHRSFFFGLALGFWLAPWLLYSYFTPFLRDRLGPEIANIAAPIELLIVVIITLLPLSFFILDALSIQRFMQGFKIREIDNLASNYLNAFKSYHNTKMQSVRSQIELIKGLKEWPLGSMNIVPIAVTIALPLAEFIVKQLLRFVENL